MDCYEILAKDYDRLNPKEQIFTQKPFFEGIIQEARIRTCLDCACGTGWHLYLLNELGLECAGSDLSPVMLDYAKSNLAGTSIPLRLGDYRDLASLWEQRFDLVICMTTALAHMVTEADAVKALNSMCAVLSPTGRLVIANGFADTLLDNQPKFIPAHTSPDIAFYYFVEYPSAAKVVFNILQVRKTKDSFEHAYQAMEYNALRQETLARYFDATPFKQVEYFGDFERHPYDPKKSMKLIAIARR